MCLQDRAAQLSRSWSVAIVFTLAVAACSNNPAPPVESSAPIGAASGGLTSAVLMKGEDLPDRLTWEDPQAEGALMWLLCPDWAHLTSSEPLVGLWQQASTDVSASGLTVGVHEIAYSDTPAEISQAFVQLKARTANCVESPGLWTDLESDGATVRGGFLSIPPVGDDRFGFFQRVAEVDRSRYPDMAPWASRSAVIRSGSWLLIIELSESAALDDAQILTEDEFDQILERAVVRLDVGT